MTVGVITPEITYLGNGSASALAVPFRFLKAADLVVTAIAADDSRMTLVRGTHYDVAGGGAGGGSVTPLAAIPVGTKWRVRRLTPREQPADYVVGDDFPPETFELTLDRTLMAVQEQDVAIDGAVRLPYGEELVELPGALGRSSRFERWSADGSQLLMLSASDLALAVSGQLAALLPGFKGDPGGNIMAIGLFQGAAGRNIPVGTDVVRTTGHTVNGIGVADYVADAAVDAAYVAANPLTSFISANGRGFRLVVHGAVYLEWLGGGAGVDNEPIFNAIKALLPGGFNLLLNGNGIIYDFNQIDIDIDNVRIGSASRDAAFIRITGNGDGGVEPGPGIGGGIRILANVVTIQDVTIQYTNPLLRCLINASAPLPGAGAPIALGVITLENLELEPGPAITSLTSNATAVYFQNLVNSWYRNSRSRSAVGWKQQLVMRGFCNSVHVDRVAFGHNVLDVANGVFHAANPMVDVDASTQSSSISYSTFSNGPNGVRVRGQGVFELKNNYMADVINSLGFWVPGLVVAQERRIYPSASITGDSTVGNTINNASSTAALYVGMKVVVIGAGAAGARVTGRITAIDGTTLTLSAAMATAVVGTSIYFGAYSGLGYIATVAGTTGAAQPAWPVAAGGTVVDGGVTWREFGSNAWVESSTVPAGSVGKQTLAIESGNIVDNIVGVLGKRNGGQVGAISVKGVLFDDCDHCGYFNNVAAADVSGCALSNYLNVGFELVTGGRNYTIGDGCYTVPAAPGADVVVSTNTNGIGGTISGLSATGIGKNRLAIFKPNAAGSPGYMQFPDGLILGLGAITVAFGPGPPEGNVTAGVGSLYLRTGGGAATTLYVKESGTGNTGWVAK